MSRGMDPNWLKMRQEVMRHNGLKGAKKTAPGGKRDWKFLFLIIGVIVAIIVLLALPVIIEVIKYGTDIRI